MLSFGKLRQMQLMPLLPGEFMCVPPTEFAPPLEKLRASLQKVRAVVGYLLSETRHFAVSLVLAVTVTATSRTSRGGDQRLRKSMYHVHARTQGPPRGPRAGGADGVEGTDDMDEDHEADEEEWTRWVVGSPLLLDVFCLLVVLSTTQQPAGARSRSTTAPATAPQLTTTAPSRRWVDLEAPALAAGTFKPKAGAKAVGGAVSRTLALVLGVSVLLLLKWAAAHHKFAHTCAHARTHTQAAAAAASKAGGAGGRSHKKGGGGGGGGGKKGGGAASKKKAAQVGFGRSVALPCS
jgi:hypothetical protein